MRAKPKSTRFVLLSLICLLLFPNQIFASQLCKAPLLVPTVGGVLWLYSQGRQHTIMCCENGRNIQACNSDNTSLCSDLKTDCHPPASTFILLCEDSQGKKVPPVEKLNRTGSILNHLGKIGLSLGLFNLTVRYLLGE